MIIKKLQINKELILAIATTISIGLTGCVEKSDCSLKELHLHRYEKGGITRYLSEEDLEFKGYEWTEDVVYISREEQELREFEQKKGLIRIADNEEYLRHQENNNHDFIEYCYSYEYLYAYPYLISTEGKLETKYMYIPMTEYEWTTDSNHPQLTGDKRLCHNVYHAYKIIKDEEGNYVEVLSPEVDDILSIKEEYPYFKENYKKVIVISETSKEDEEDLLEDNQDNHQAKEYAKK